MSKLNLLTKKFNKYAFSIKDFIENSFLNLKNFISNIRKGKLSNNNRVFLTPLKSAKLFIKEVRNA